MKRGPLVTLVVVAVLGLVLLAVNMAKDTEPAVPAAATTPTTAPATTQTAPSATPPAVPARPTGAPFPATADYVGTIPIASGTITLSIAVAADKAVAYACDGTNIESWLSGTAVDGTVKLQGRNDSRLEGRFDGATVRGTLWIGARTWDFTTAPAAPPAGLYLYTEGAVRDSWIVDQTGSVTGVRRGADGATSPAPALNPGAKKVGGGDGGF